ncbi:MAG: immunity 26/phosphotriesterase HocA family protein [Ekhidna sp.]|nr:immunity 26/phosphotriesterase HocA family protein [Ekhidna sp.]
MLELTNRQREYLGLDLIESDWERFELKAGPYQPESTLYFEGDFLKKQIVSNENQYYEWPVNIQTRSKSIILPKTSKGKEKKLTAATLEKYKPDGVAFEWTVNGTVFITNHNTQINYYSNFLEGFKINNPDELANWIENYISSSPDHYLDELRAFKDANRKNIKYKPGDFFAFKVSRTEFGFGRILLDVNKLRKKKLIPKHHGLQLIMGPPLLVKIYGFMTDTLEVDLEELAKQKSLPSDYIMDNHIFYGENPIIGNLPLEPEEYEFPISFGRSISALRPGITFLQWGFIHLEKPIAEFNKYLSKDDGGLGEHNPYGYYSNGFYPRYMTKDIKKTIEEGNYLFDSEHYKDQWDLRNPLNKEIKIEILENFGLDPNKSYLENCQKIGIDPIAELK